MRTLFTLLMLTVAGLAIASAAPLRAADDDLDLVVKKFREADAEDRDRYYRQLEEQMYEHELLILLNERLAAARKRVGRAKEIKSLGKLSEKRRELDLIRREAVGIIFDEVRYFTPYKPPEVSAERHAEYRKVQAEIDELVEEAGELWHKTKPVKLKAAFRTALDDLLWTYGKVRELDSTAKLPEGLPSWIRGVDPSAEVVGIDTFAWSAEEAEALATDRRILRYNELVAAQVQQAKEGVEDDERPAAIEVDQVRVTNDYRRLLGHPVLAWDRRIQKAVRWHCDYMDRRGTLTHFQEDVPGMRTPGERMRKAGYERGNAENVAGGQSGPEDVHRSWSHSPGHHRNLLARGHRAMATGKSGRYWTQNFGADRVSAETMEEVLEAGAPKRRRRR